MSDSNRDAGVVQYGRPNRKRSRGPKLESAAADAPAVGPLDPDAVVDGAQTIIRAERRPEPTHEVLGAPKPRVARERHEPDDIDFQLRELVAYMARGIVDHPESVAVAVLEAGENAVFELSVHSRDIGHVIGKQGRTARSLRLALSAAAARHRRQADIDRRLSAAGAAPRGHGTRRGTGEACRWS